MPTNLLARRRSPIARLAVIALIAGLLAIPAIPAGAATAACPSTIPPSGFTDVVGLSTEAIESINCIKFYGITTGTTATTFSPNQATLRYEMALFLTRSAVDMGITLPSGADQGFTDLGGFSAAAVTAINQTKQLGISKGTTATTFSPGAPTLRYEMALFLTRLLKADGFTLPSGSDQGFTDLGGFSAEAVTAINQLKQLGITTGTTATTYDPNGVVFRWQMALFIARTLNVAGVTPAGLQVTVTPGDSVTLATGLSRTYTATFKNTDGTNYTGTVGIQLLDVSGTSPVYNDPTENVNISATTDLVINGAADEANGVAGTDGSVTFTVTNDGTAEKVIPVAWIDTDNDQGYETTGNVSPTEPFGLGGLTDFVAGPAVEATTGTHTGFGVTKTTKASDVFEASLAATNCGNGAGNACSFFYDSGDIFSVDGAAATLADFESALSRGDTVTATYDADTADQSTFALTDNIAELKVTDPSAAKTVDAATYAIKGTSDPEATIRVKADLNNNNVVDPGEATVATGTADVDGNWTVTTPLQQNVANNFLVSQQPVGGVQRGGEPFDANGGHDDVFTITEGAAAAATITATASPVNGGVSGTLDVGDRIDIDFSKSVQAPTSGDTVDILENPTGGTQVRLTCGTNASCSAFDTDTIRVTVTAAPTILVAGDNSAVNTGGVIQALGGFIDSDGLAVNVAGSAAAAKTFVLS